MKGGVNSSIKEDIRPPSPTKKRKKIRYFVHMFMTNLFEIIIFYLKPETQNLLWEGRLKPVGTNSQLLSPKILLLQDPSFSKARQKKFHQFLPVSVSVSLFKNDATQLRQKLDSRSF